MLRFFASRFSKLILTGVFAFLAVVALFFVGAAKLILDDQLTSAWARKFVAVVPVPAASVQGKWVLYRDVLVRWDDVDRFYALRDPALPAKTIPELRQEAYEQLIRERYIQAQADKEQFSLAEDMVQKNVEQVLLGGATSTQLLLDQAYSDLQNRFGWSAEDFKNRIIRPATLEEALALRAEIGGISREDWTKHVEQVLQSKQIVRFLSFSTPVSASVPSSTTPTP